MGSARGGVGRARLCVLTPNESLARTKYRRRQLRKAPPFWSSSPSLMTKACSMCITIDPQFCRLSEICVGVTEVGSARDYVLHGSCGGWLRRATVQRAQAARWVRAGAFATTYAVAR